MKSQETNPAFELAEAEIEEVTISVRLKHGPPVTVVYGSRELREFKFRWKEEKRFEQRNDEFQSTGQVSLNISMSYIVKKIEDDFIRWQAQHPH